MRVARGIRTRRVPSAAAIWEKFTTEPLAPEIVMMERQFFENGFFVPRGRHFFTAADVTLFREPDAFMSNCAPHATFSLSLAATASPTSISDFPEASATSAVAALHISSALLSCSTRSSSACS